MRTNARLWGVLLLPVALSWTGCSCNELALEILTQPADQSVVEGASATFTVKANAAVTGYQWQHDTGAGFTDLSGATEGTYHTGASSLAMSGTRFRVVVSGTGQTSLTSDPAMLTVTVAAVAPAIVTQPVDQRATAGSTATFSVSANGTSPLSYRWQRSTGGPFTDVSGATSATYATPATSLTEDGNRFQVVVSNVAGTVTSTAATLAVGLAASAPAIVTAPADQLVDQGQPASFTVVVSGSPTPTLQWRRAELDAGFVSLAGQTGPTLTLASTAPSDTGARFEVVASNDAGVATSAAATLTVRSFAAPIITQQPADLTVDSGTPATFTVVATGTPAPTYQWRDGTTQGALDGGTLATLTLAHPTLDDDGRLVQVVVSNSQGSVTSATAKLTVLPAALTGFSEVSTAVKSTLALKDGTVYAWGANNYGQLGRPGFDNDPRPRPVGGLTGTFLHVLMRGETGYALRDDHTVWAWGSNSHGQLGNAAVALGGKSATPVQVLRQSDDQPLTDIVTLAADDADSGGAEVTAFGVTSTGALWSWGSAYVEPATPTPTGAHPQAVPNVYFDASTPARTIKQIGAGSTFGYAIAGDDHCYGWVRVVPQATTTVTAVNLSGSFLDLSVSWNNAYVVTASHEVWDVLPTVPLKVPLTFEADWVRTGQHGSLTIAHRRDTGGLYAWGLYTQSGGLGDGTGPSSRAPADAVPVLGLFDAALVAVGQSSAIALRPGGALWGWGDNEWGSLGTTPLTVPTYRLSPYPLTGL